MHKLFAICCVCVCTPAWCEVVFENSALKTRASESRAIEQLFFNGKYYVVTTEAIRAGVKSTKWDPMVSKVEIQNIAKNDPRIANGVEVGRPFLHIEYVPEVIYERKVSEDEMGKYDLETRIGKESAVKSIAQVKSEIFERAKVDGWGKETVKVVLHLEALRVIQKVEPPFYQVRVEWTSLRNRMAELQEKGKIEEIKRRYGGGVDSGGFRYRGFGACGSRLVRHLYSSKNGEYTEVQIREIDIEKIDLVHELARPHVREVCVFKKLKEGIVLFSSDKLGMTSEGGMANRISWVFGSNGIVSIVCLGGDPSSLAAQYLEKYRSGITEDTVIDKRAWAAKEFDRKVRENDQIIDGKDGKSFLHVDFGPVELPSELGFGSDRADKDVHRGKLRMIEQWWEKSRNEMVWDISKQKLCIGDGKSNDSKSNPSIIKLADPGSEK